MKTLAHILVLMVLCSCSHQALVPLKFDPQIDTDPVSVIEANGHTVYLENIQRKSDLLVFDLEVKNTTNQPIRIQPAKLYYYAGYNRFEQVDDTVTMDLGNAYGSAEQRSNRQYAMRESGVERYYQSKADEQKALGIFLLVVGAGLIINDAIQDANDSQQAVWTESDVNRSITRDALTVGGLVAIDIAASQAERTEIESYEELVYVPDEIFRDAYISPGQSMRGKVFFNNPLTYKYYRLIVPVGDTDFIFDFRKRKQADRDKLRAYDLRKNGW